MTDHPETPGASADGEVHDAATGEQPAATWVPEPAPVADGSQLGGSPAADRPELSVGAAFAGGLLAALILKRLAR